MHELLGHFTQLDQQVNQRQLTEVGQAPDGRTLHTTANVWSDAGRNVYEQAAQFAQQMSQPNANLEQIRWRAWLPGQDEPVELQGVEDPRLLEASRLELQGVNVSNYGNTNHYEAWAEAAASHVTDGAVPFENSAIVPIQAIRRTRPDQGIAGTVVSQQWVAELGRVWGQLSDEDREHMESSWQHRFGNPDEFEFMRELAQFARHAAVWAQNDPRWVRIVTGQLFTEQ